GFQAGRARRAPAARLRARISHAGIYCRPRTRSRSTRRRVRADEPSLPGRHHDLRARAGIVPRHPGRGRPADFSDRRHGTAAAGTRIISAFVRGVMKETVQTMFRRARGIAVLLLLASMTATARPALAAADAQTQPAAERPATAVAHEGGEANLVLPDL